MKYYWHCDTCHTPLIEWDAPCPECRKSDTPSLALGLIMAVAMSLIVLSSLFL